jgi:hypothetical protein
VECKGTISAILENISVSNRLVRKISTDLYGVAISIKDGIALNHHSLTGGSALPVVLAIPFVAIAVHVDRVDLPAQSLCYRTASYEAKNAPEVVQKSHRLRSIGA